MRFTTLLLLVVLLPPAAIGEEPNAQPSTRFSDQVEVEEVLLDVLVTDRKGRAVVGLTAEDFAVEERGRALEISGASFYSTRYGATETEIGQKDDETLPASRYFIYFFHDQRRNTTMQGELIRRQMEALRESRRWVDEEMLPSDWVAVMSYDAKLKVYQDFTQSREALYQAFDALSRHQDAETSSEQRQASASSNAPSLLRGLAEGKELRRQTKRIYDALRLVAEASGSIVGRKNLLLFSIGFGEMDSFAPFARGDQRFYPAMKEALNANNVAVYTIDMVPARFEHTQTHFLNGLAVDTGGSYYRNFVSFITPLRNVTLESSGYYLLSIRAEIGSGDEIYREIKVSVEQPGLTVKARRGFRQRR